MNEFTVINFIILAILMTVIAAYLSLRRQKNVMMDEISRLSLRLAEMEMKVKALPPLQEEEASDGEEGYDELSGETPQARLEEPDVTDDDKASSPDSDTPDLSAMTDEELFAYLSKTIKDDELFRNPDLNRTAVMKRFSLSAVRIGKAFARGGGMGLPEFVRNCRLDYACRLMVEQPEMPFNEVGSQSGYTRTTTFYHDFKARFGMPPAEYREREK